MPRLLRLHNCPLGFPAQELTASCTSRLAIVLRSPRNRGIDRKDILRIEHLIRKGRRQLDLFRASEVTGIRLAGMGDGSRSSKSTGREAAAAVKDSSS